MLNVSQRFVDDVLWPEYEEMADLLHEYLDDVTTSVIEDVLGQKDEDAAEIAGELR